MQLATGEAAACVLCTMVPGVTLWSPATPALYAVEASLVSGGAVVDSVVRRTGFRSIAAREGRLFLNGEPLTLAGFNRHEDTPAVAMAEDVDAVRRDLRSMRAGANLCGSATTRITLMS